MRILGIDPGLNITGYGLLEKTPGTTAPKLLEGGVVRGGGSDEDLPFRLREIHHGIAEHPDGSCPRRDRAGRGARAGARL